MKFLLVGINAKYIHSNPAIFSLKAYAEDRLELGDNQIEICEYTINQLTDDILTDIYRKQADVVMFSTYIWNVEMVMKIVRELKLIAPFLHIWLGGPEVSYNYEKRLGENDLTGIIIGEGEETTRELIDCYLKTDESNNKGIISEKNELLLNRLKEVKGIAFNGREGLIKTEDRECLDFSTIPFPYKNLEDFEDRIVYYETSRGCPFKCAYCLSSVEKSLRLRSMELVKEELTFFLEHKVPQVKFIDRTFNCNRQRTLELLNFIKENDNGITNFHFEIAGDILTDEECEILNSLRTGLVQLEIGVQSTNPETLKAINRTTDMDRLATNVSRLINKDNIHVHLDLIAGLPYEGYESFVKSFNDVYAFHPHELQLGFLKMLSGAPIGQRIEEDEIKYRQYPPYEVLSTKYISFDEIITLKQVEEVLEIYYNSRQFKNTILWLESLEKSPFEMYLNIARFYEEAGYFKMQSSRAKRYDYLLDYVKTKYPDKAEACIEYMTLDYYLREKAKSRPDFAGEFRYDDAKAFYTKAENIEKYLPDYRGVESKNIQRQTHFEKFDVMGKTIVFDYQNKCGIDQEARLIFV